MGFIDKIKKGLKHQPEKSAVSPKVSDEKNKQDKATESKKTEGNVSRAKKSAISKNLLKKENLGEILIRPLITEKALVLGKFNQYVFEVASKSNKIEIAQAVEIIYGVRPIKVNIINNLGKWVRYGRSFGQQSGVKKAVVVLPEGKTITINEGV